jgi:phosphatidylserine decarboxylase
VFLLIYVGFKSLGGSTIVILFEKGFVEWDDDLLDNGRASLETLVRVGMGIGRGQKSIQV